MKTKHQDPNKRFAFVSTPPDECDTVVKSAIQVDKEGREFSTVHVEKRDFSTLEGIQPKDFSVSVLQRSNPAALKIVNKKLTRDRLSALDNLQEQAEGLVNDPMLNPQTSDNE